MARASEQIRERIASMERTRDRLTETARIGWDQQLGELRWALERIEAEEAEHEGLREQFERMKVIHHNCELRRDEARALLQRFVRYIREDKAITPSATRLSRLTSQVADYLKRTHDPAAILRAVPEAACYCGTPTTVHDIACPLATQPDAGGDRD